MRLVSIRKGFATNSSSSHSILLVPTKVKSRPAYNYGWEDFVLTTREEKADYFAKQAFDYYTGRIGDHEAAEIVNRYFGTNESVVGFKDIDIDHESVLHFPSPRVVGQGMTPLWEWIVDNIINTPDAVVFGGNDNSDGNPYIPAGAESFAMPFGRYFNGYQTLYKVDPLGYLVTFNTRTGEKCRYVGRETVIPDHSSTPELVDIKITDYCTHGCSYCYQDSGENGNHANLSVLSDLAWKLSTLGVFEVALGGGDPTMHPAFAEVIKLFGEQGITVNFSTRSVEWAQYPAAVEAVKKYVGDYAWSIDGPYGWLPNEPIREQTSHTGHVLHVVMGSMPTERFERLLMEVEKEYGARIVLLAYKGNIGRAPAKPPHDPVGWWPLIRDSDLLKRGRISVDTFLGEAVKKHLPGVDPRSYELHDGRFSCYYDAVNQRIAEHSFVPPDKQESCQPCEIKTWWDKRW